MVTVTAGELSPLVTGLMYCSVIAACQQVYAFDRTREWTAALTRWCEGQPDMVAFAGVCQVHRAEIMQLRGTWPEAIEEARRACARSQGVNQQAAAAALYQQAEVHRLKGEFAAAEEAYRGASQLGLEPQPGLALLRLAQGRSDAAATAIRRVASTTADRLKRMSLLPAYIEIMLAAGDVQDARDACRELEEIARSFDTGVPGAIAAQACGAVDLAEGDAQAALGSLRRAFEVWQRIEAPYAAARVRVLIGLACRALGDEDGAALEIDAARSIFERLGATPDLARIDALMKGTAVRSRSWTDAARAPGPSPDRHRRDQQGDRRQAVPEREDGRPARQQHLRQARCLLAGCGDGLCLPAQARSDPPKLVGAGIWVKSPMPPPAQLGCFPEARSSTSLIAS